MLAIAFQMRISDVPFCTEGCKEINVHTLVRSDHTEYFVTLAARESQSTQEATDLLLTEIANLLTEVSWDGATALLVQAMGGVPLLNAPLVGARYAGIAHIT